MPVSIREQLISAIQTRLEPLAPGAVGRGISASGQLPAIMLWDVRETVEHRASSALVSMTLGVESVALQTSEGTANELLAALVQTMSATDPHFGGIADSCRYVGSEIEYPESGSELVGVRASFDLKYTFKSGDPYSQP